MTIRRFQTRVTQSRYALPVMIGVALCVWWIAGLKEHGWYVQLITLLVSTYLMVELNTNNALLHMYSRMVSCAFLTLTIMASFLFPSAKTAFCILSYVMFCTLIFNAYQDNHAQGTAYYAFLCLGLSSIYCVQILFLAPFLWLLSVIYLKAFSFKMLWASLLGLITPYWFLVCIDIGTGHISSFVNHFKNLIKFAPLFSFEGFTVNEVITYGFSALLMIIGAVYYLMKKRPDRVRTRMIYHFFIASCSLFVVAFLLQPQHRESIYGMFMVSASPLIAHFFASTHTRPSNWFFSFVLMISSCIIALNLWKPSLTF